MFISFIKIVKPFRIYRNIKTCPVILTFDIRIKVKLFYFLNHKRCIADKRVTLISKDNKPSIAWICRICTFYFLPFHLEIDSVSSASITQYQLPINIIPTLWHGSGPNALLFNPSILNSSNLI